MSRRRRKGRSHRRVHLNKPRGRIDKRVEAVGPKHFGMLSVDCGKGRSTWMLADFYGNVLVPPTQVEHHQTGFRQAGDQLAEALRRHQIKDLLVAVERPGDYHQPVKRAFASAGYQVRIVHPFASKQFRQADTCSFNNPIPVIFLPPTAVRRRYARQAISPIPIWLSFPLEVQPAGSGHMYDRARLTAREGRSR